MAIFALVLTACATPPTTAPQSSAIDYTRTGGIIGANDHLVIDANGHAKLTRRTISAEFDLSRDQLSQIQAAFQTAGFATLKENSMPAQPVADGFIYEIVYQGHKVRTGDTAVPEKLQPVVQILNRMVDSGGK